MTVTYCLYFGFYVLNYQICNVLFDGLDC